MILSVSRRTDIPAFFHQWFLNRIKEGYVLVRNPYHYHQVSLITLSPSVIDCLVFWTKNPLPMIADLNQLKEYPFYFHITLTPYDKSIERNVPDKHRLIESFITLSQRIGKEKVIWRYDPVILTDKITIDDHLDLFRHLAGKLSGYTDLCIISFIDDYQKIRKNMKAIHQTEISEKAMVELSKGLVKIADSVGITIKTCSEKIDLSFLGIEHARCIDDRLISSIVGYPVTIDKDKHQREACGCVKSIDIGSYNTCRNGCIYCYASESLESCNQNNLKHDVLSLFLIGHLLPEDVITKRMMTSYRDLPIKR